MVMRLLKLFRLEAVVVASPNPPESSLPVMQTEHVQQFIVCYVVALQLHSNAMTPVPFKVKACHILPPLVRAGAVYSHLPVVQVLFDG